MEEDTPCPTPPPPPPLAVVGVAMTDEVEVVGVLGPMMFDARTRAERGVGAPMLIDC